MKNLTIILSIVLCVTCIVGLSESVASAKTLETIIETKIGKVIDGGGLSKVVLYGTYPNKGLYAENIRIEIKDLKTDKTILEIKPTTNGGYKPSIILENFKTENDDLQQIFLGINNGGSGGYGYFYIFDVANKKPNVIFDYEKWEKTYSADYMDNFKVKIQETTNKNTAGEKYIIDISNRDKEYLNKLYNANGTLKTPTQGDVSGVNYVFPYYSSQSGKFELQVFQRIIGLYEADMLGYIVTLLNFEGDNFKPIYTFVGIV